MAGVNWAPLLMLQSGGGSTEMGYQFNTKGMYWDMQTVSQAQIWHQLDDQAMRLTGLRLLQDRLAKLQAGRSLVFTMGHGHVEDKIRQVDPGLTLRWEFDHPDNTEEHPITGMYAVDRYVPELGYYWTLCFWSHRFGDGTGLRQIMLESDMQRPEYLQSKKYAQELALQYQAKRRAEMAGEAIDKLTLKRAQEFIKVSQALRTGENIRSQGEDARLLNKWYAETKRRDALGIGDIPGRDHAINPGFDPNLRGA